MNLRHVAAAAAALLLAACQASNQPAPTAASDESAIAPILTGADAVDIHSYAKPLEARVTHVALDLNVDFTAKRLGGTATLDVEAKPDAKQIILDDKGLEIESIADASGKPLAYTVGAVDPILGAPLAITLGEARRIVITYKSAPDSERAAMADARADRRQAPSLSCSARARRSTTAAGSRPRIRPESARPGKPRSPSPRR